MTAKTEYLENAIIAEEKKYKLEQTKIIRNSGAGTDFEESLFALEWVMLNLRPSGDKNYQQTILNFVHQGDEFNKVSVKEVESEHEK